MVEDVEGIDEGHLPGQKVRWVVHPLPAQKLLGFHPVAAAWLSWKKK